MNPAARTSNPGFRAKVVPLVGAVLLIGLVGITSAVAQQAAPQGSAEAHDTQQVDSPEDAASAERYSAESYREWRRRVDENPLNQSVLYNAALHAAHAGAIGEARLYLERANVLHPFDRQTRDALALVRQAVSRAQLNAVGDGEYTEGVPAGVGLWRVTRLLPQTTTALIFMISLWLLAFSYILRSPSRSKVWNRWLLAASCLFLLIAALSGLMWVGAGHTQATVSPAVVVSDSPYFYRSPDTLGVRSRSNELYEGALVAIESRTDDWVRLRLADEERVWVHADLVAPLEPDELEAE